MESYKHLHKVIHDDVKDMEMLYDYAENAIECGDKRLATHFMDRMAERKRGMEQSLDMMEAHTEHHNEREKAMHECMMQRLKEDVEEIENDFKELRRKM